MRVLVACEYSGVVRDAFRALGHDAQSCDLLPSEGDPDGIHWQCDILDLLDGGWDLMVAHPPCTYLSNSGVKHLYIGGRKENGRNEENWELMEQGAEFFNAVADAPIPRKAIENPVMHPHAQKLVGGKATQYVQPWWFGSKKNKATGFRLIELPPLVKTNVVGPMPKSVKKGTAEYRSWHECWYMSPGKDRGHKRAKTNKAIADALAIQWGGLELQEFGEYRAVGGIMDFTAWQEHQAKGS
jgi:hypothetical protein